jgi:peroxiredoxin Q/BCP
LNAVILGISPDSTDSHKKFIAKHKLKVALLSDPEKKVLKKFGAWGIKKSYGKESEGVIRSTFLISPEGKLAENWTKVKVRVKKKTGEVRHADLVFERLQEEIG